MPDDLDDARLTELLERWQEELAEPRWVTLAEAEEAAGVSRSALRSWYRNDELLSRLVDGPYGPQRVVPLDAVIERARQSGRVGRRPRLADRIAELERRVAELERRLDDR